jgi:SLOG in TRPM, prokaryote
VDGDLAVFGVRFPGGNRARAVRVAPGCSPAALVSALALPRPRPLVVLNGGTGELPPELAGALGPPLADGLAGMVANGDVTVLDGGTDAGIFAVLGAGLAERPGRGCSVGVAPEELVTWPGRRRPPRDAVALEPHHSHFVLVEGSDWGAETATMFALAAALSEGTRSVAVVANGGAIVRDETRANLAQRREVVVLAGSGRFADELAAAARGQAEPTDPLTAAMARDPHLTVVDLGEGRDALVGLLRHRLSRTP